MMCPWSQYEKDPFPFCEEQLCQWISQPANTWSNIGYFIAAWLIWKHHRNSAFALITLYLAIGSTLFHISGTMWGKILDVSAMLLLSGLCLSFSVVKTLKLPRWMGVLFFGGLSLVTLPWVGHGKLGGYIFVAEVIATVALEFRLRHTLGAQKWQDLKRVMVIFPTALGLNMMDQHGPLCWPSNHIFTVHGLWHLMTAYCLYLIAKFYSAK